MKIQNQELINLTPHEVTLFLPDGEKLEIPPSGQVLRVGAKLQEIGRISGLPIERKTLGTVEGEIPPEIPGTWYITSSIAAQAIGREDMLIPSPVRDPSGRIIGAKGFFVVGQRGVLE